MKTLSIDIETYSSENLAKCGVYRYAESPDFEVLLFGYSADGGPVEVVDLAAGEMLSADVRSALTDPAVTKWAFNAQFERVCLSRFLGYPTGQYLDPSSWHCTMVWAATLGLPLSLEGVGAVLGLEKQKLKEGKDLIRYFCTPAKARDGSQFRHYLSDAPEKWALFKAYITPVIENIIAALPTVLDALLTAVGELLPTLLESVTELFSQVLETLLSLLPQLIPAAVQALMTIVNTLIENLPLLIDAAVQLVTTLVTGIGDALPTLIPAAVQAIVTIVQGLVDSLPMILDAALQLITGLAQGLLDAIPVLIAALPEIINGIITFLLDSIPQIIETGIQLLTSLVTALPEIITAIVEAIPKIIDGIINAVLNAIPQIIQAGIDLLISLIQALPQIITTIVQAIPQIISGIVNALVGNIDKIIMAGVKLFVSLIENLPNIIVEIVKAVPQIIAGIVKAFGSLMYKIVEIGGNIVKGLWSGIQQLASWLWDKVSGWISSIWDGICDFFGIHSPSKEMAWVGEMLVKGLAGSIDDNGDEAVKAAEGMAEDINGVMGDLAHDIINNGPRKTVAELEEQSRNGTPISLLELAQAVQREDAEKRRAQQPVRREKSGEKPSILAKLKTPSVADTKSVKSAPKRSAEREL